MNLPHQAPIKFAQKVLQNDFESAIIECSFPYQPSLSMLFEAAAQSSVAFNQDDKKIGYVVMVKNLELIQTIQDNTVLVNISKNTHMHNIHEFSFLITNEGQTVLAKGELVLKLETS